MTDSGRRLREAARRLGSHQNAEQLDVVELAALLRIAERDRDSARARTRGPSDPMNVAFRIETSGRADG